VANDILNKFKSNPDSWLVVDRILQQASNPNTKFFALQILEEAVNVIGEKCDERNIDFNSVELKPLEILKYVDSATDKIYEKVSTT
jgi:hypothetical protein